MTFPGAKPEPPAADSHTARMPDFPRLVPGPIQDPALAVDPVDAHAAEAIAICNGQPQGDNR